MQKIYYGAPGTGKSYEVDQYIRSNSIPNERVFRCTFHPEYTYSDFIGQLLPTVIKSGTHKGDITYSFSKGVFTLALEKAYEDTNKDVYLIVEEMSRGDCSAIFGDVFQLLDRISSGVDKGYSRYFINNAVIANDILAISDDHVKLPPNLSIIGTVNTSDQNVYVMDTAFKRRFEWEYISTKPIKSKTGYLNNIELELASPTGIKTLTWIDFYGILNKVISSAEYLDLGEDKQLGQFFVEFNKVAASSDHVLKIKNKLLHFLWNDIHRISYKTDFKLFNSGISSFSDLYDFFDKKEQIFSNEFFKCVELWEKNSL